MSERVDSAEKFNIPTRKMSVQSAFRNGVLSPAFTGLSADCASSRAFLGLYQALGYAVFLGLCGASGLSK
eukprot:726727-Rhodomonas_salina.4